MITIIVEHIISKLLYDNTVHWFTVVKSLESQGL